MIKKGSLGAEDGSSEEEMLFFHIVGGLFDLLVILCLFGVIFHLFVVISFLCLVVFFFLDSLCVFFGHVLSVAIILHL